MRFLFGFLFLLQTFLFFEARAQKPSQLAEKGSEALKQNDFFSAAQYYEEALKKDSSEVSWWFDYAESCRLSQNYSSAERAYLKVNELDKGKEFPWAMFYLGETKKIQGKYKEASKLFEKSIRRFQKKNPPLKLASERGLDDCKFALEALKNPVEVAIHRAPPIVNTSGSDLAPLSRKGWLYFSSTNPENGKNQLKKWRLDSSENPFFLSSDSSLHISSISLGEDNGYRICSVCQSENSRLRCKLAEFSISGDGILDSIRYLPEPINLSGSNQTHPSLGKIGDTEFLFFSSDREGGEGGMDIWYSRRKKGGLWEKPIQAGKEINTEKDEISPYLCSPCEIVFFSSDGRTGMGGLDIFRSKMLLSGFSPAENMGAPFNSGYHEVNFSLSDEGKKAWFSSNRPDENKKTETCCNDLFSIEFPGKINEDSLLTVKDSIRILGKKISTLVPLSLYFNNDEPDRKTISPTTAQNYKNTCEEYLKDEANYFKAYSKGLHEERKEKAISEIEDFFEDSVRAGLGALETFTDLMFNILQKGGKIEITMKGYCSPLASSDYNINLAKRRICSLKNYFNEWSKGALLSNMEDGSLILREEQIGELKTASQVSDNPNDQLNSVYSLSAALERRIEIVAVSTSDK